MKDGRVVTRRYPTLSTLQNSVPGRDRQELRRGRRCCPGCRLSHVEAPPHGQSRSHDTGVCCSNAYDPVQRRRPGHGRNLCSTTRRRGGTATWGQAPNDSSGTRGATAKAYILGCDGLATLAGRSTMSVTLYYSPVHTSQLWPMAVVRKPMEPRIRRGGRAFSWRSCSKAIGRIVIQ